MANILLIEDDAHILRILSMWLQRNGHSVVEARDGLIGREMLSKQTFDLVVSDVNMPGMDGIEVVRWLRHEVHVNTPVILLSSRADQSSMAAELESMAVQLHPKPFSPSRLVAEVEKQLAGALPVTATETSPAT